ncbi:flavodoxin family protein [Pseudoflavonifractor phocaeensis]|uniref:flavodoxin family protein n=1 Tax=Pseudoflavonifractor phocaeensis TaxID=1870988 RepID=UPI0025A4121A|nr:flavodoxin family protein [Pseudoflavonifractor phocaeensis]MDM8237662.1 flavodoxin family protein [Pseudoflavonifractor phocaeensis]
MSKHVLVISTSPRKGGNSDTLADQFVRGAQQAGNQVEKVTLYDKTIGFCKGCLACQTTQRCVIHDDAETIAQKMLTADVIAFATPIYYYGMCGQMKTMLDRANPLFPADYQFRDIYLLAAAAEEEEHTVDGAVTGLQGWIDCFEKARLAGIVFAGDVTTVGEIQNHPALKQAYELGKHV